jgi:putative ABC transport system permease protein
LAIAIACLGLLGLIAYTAEVRTKEIGIRKVLGATETSIVSLLTKEFLVLVVLASLFAYPVAYYTMNSWLQNFAYRIGLSFVYFIASTGATLIITLITIAYQALKAARTNPIEALRYE